MTSAAIGNLTGAVLFLVVVFTVIGALASGRGRTTRAVQIPSITRATSHAPTVSAASPIWSSSSRSNTACRSRASLSNGLSRFLNTTGVLKMADELEKIEHWQFGHWLDASEFLPPIGERVVASNGKEFWLDMRHEFMPTLGCGAKKALYWCPFDSLAEFLQDRRRHDLAAQRAKEEPDVIF